MSEHFPDASPSSPNHIVAAAAAAVTATTATTTAPINSSSSTTMSVNAQQPPPMTAAPATSTIATTTTIAETTLSTTSALVAATTTAPTATATATPTIVGAALVTPVTPSTPTPKAFATATNTTTTTTPAPTTPITTPTRAKRPLLSSAKAKQKKNHQHRPLHLLPSLLNAGNNNNGRDNDNDDTDSNNSRINSKLTNSGCFIVDGHTKIGPTGLRTTSTTTHTTSSHNSHNANNHMSNSSSVNMNSITISFSNLNMSNNNSHNNNNNNRNNTMMDDEHPIGVNETTVFRNKEGQISPTTIDNVNAEPITTTTTTTTTTTRTTTTSSSSSSRSSSSSSSSSKNCSGINFNDLIISERTIGAGACAKVRKCVHKVTNKKFAIKEIPFDPKCDEKKHKIIVAEFKALCHYQSSNSNNNNNYNNYNNTLSFGNNSSKNGSNNGNSQKSGQQHRNIIRMYDAYLRHQKLYMLLEYMDCGSLADLVKYCGCLPESLLSKIAEQVLSGLHYLHDSKSIVHRDIKPENILVNSKGEVKLADFGMAGHGNEKMKNLVSLSSQHQSLAAQAQSQQAQSSQSSLSSSSSNGSGNSLSYKRKLFKTYAGTCLFMSPERIMGEAHGFDSDIWSLGLSLAQLAIGRNPIEHGQYWDLVLRHQEENTGADASLGIDYGSLNVSVAFQDFLRQCLKMNPSHRPSAFQLLQHEFVKPSGVQSNKSATSVVRKFLCEVYIPKRKQLEEEQFRNNGHKK